MHHALAPKLHSRPSCKIHGTQAAASYACQVHVHFLNLAAAAAAVLLQVVLPPDRRTCCLLRPPARPTTSLVLHRTTVPPYAAGAIQRHRGVRDSAAAALTPAPRKCTNSCLSACAWQPTDSRAAKSLPASCLTHIIECGSRLTAHHSSAVSGNRSQTLAPRRLAAVIPRSGPGHPAPAISAAVLIPPLTQLLARNSAVGPMAIQVLQSRNSRRFPCLSLPNGHSSRSCRRHGHCTSALLKRALLPQRP